MFGPTRHNVSWQPNLAYFNLAGIHEAVEMVWGKRTLSSQLGYEYVNGDIVATTGGSIAHNNIAINLLSALRPHLRQQGCRINLKPSRSF